MWIIWRLLPVIVVGIALWRVVPALGTGMRSMSRGNAITSINARRFANALQGELGQAMQNAPPEDESLFSSFGSHGTVDAWNRPFKVRKDRDTIEVVSCGEDGRCGTPDDIIEAVRADGTRERVDSTTLKPKSKKPAAGATSRNAGSF
jgi:hypothetical protein